jgi:hypothetical protein
MGPFSHVVGFERLCRDQSAPMSFPRSSEMSGVAPLETTLPQGGRGQIFALLLGHTQVQMQCHYMLLHPNRIAQRMAGVR